MNLIIEIARVVPLQLILLAFLHLAVSSVILVRLFRPKNRIYVLDNAHFENTARKIKAITKSNTRLKH